MKKKGLIIAIVFILFVFIQSNFNGEISVEDYQDKMINEELLHETRKNIPIYQEEYYESLGTFKLTAYCPCTECSEGYGYSTASGKKARSNHTVAVDTDVIPLGSTIIINGAEYVAEDVGGAVNGKIIDIFFETHEDVEKFGVKYSEVFVEK